MEAPMNFSQKTGRDETFKKANKNNENYTLNIKLKDNYSIYISATFEGENILYEDTKSLVEIKKKQAYFDEYTIEEIYDEISDLISKNNIEINTEHDSILLNIILPSKKKKTLDFNLETKKSNNMDNDLLKQIINQKEEIIKKQDEIIKQKDSMLKKQDDIIKQKDEIIKQKDLIIKSMESIIKNNNSEKGTKEKNGEKDREKEKQANNGNNNNIDYNKIFQNFNIVNHTPKNILSNHGKKNINTIIQLQDGRLASGGNDGSIIIYNSKTFEPEITIKEHSSNIYDLIQLKNGNVVSCSSNDKMMNVYEINENNNYKLISQINAGKDNEPRQIVELENGEIGLVAYNSIIFYLNINNKLNEDFFIKFNDNQIGKYRGMLSVRKGELVISGENKIQFFELDSRKLKEIIKINSDICWAPFNLLCMMNERCLCVGGKNKITLIDIYNKNIIREIEENGVNYCLCKLNDNTLLIGKDSGDITQWKINENNLALVYKKEKAHQGYIYKIIRSNNLVISCSNDYSIKVW